MQHVRLNVVWIGTDGRCADLRSDVKWCLMREAGEQSAPHWFRTRPAKLLAVLYPHPPERGLRSAPP